MSHNQTLPAFVSCSLLSLCTVAYGAAPDFDHLLSDLGSHDFPTRERASSEIQNLLTPKNQLTKEQVAKLQRATISRHPEVRTRAGRLIEYGPFQLVTQPVLDPDSLTLVRVANGRYEFLSDLSTSPMTLGITRSSGPTS